MEIIMEKVITSLLFALLRSGIKNIPMQEEEKEIYSVDAVPALAAMASRHDLSHILALGLTNNSFMDKNDIAVRRIIMQTVHRYERIRYELDRIYDVLEKAEIPFIPLKGSVIRKYYPEPWMRTSCDIDILVSDENCERAADILVSELDYIRKGKGSHDISMFTQSNLHVELHYALVEVFAKCTPILNRVWELSSVVDGWNYRMEMPDELFYFYHVAHMAKHFQNGGCGIRTFMDLWILDNLPDVDIEKRNALLKDGDMVLFASAARNLSRVWFGGGEHDDLTTIMERYILHGGKYGTLDNQVTVHQQKRGGRIKYALSKIFISYNTLKFQYPIIQKHKWLTPIMHIRRWGRIIFSKHIFRSIKQLKYNSNVTKNEAEEMKVLLSDIGLLDK
jgi:hypothetical protein